MEKLNISGKIADSIVDGPGIRTVIFFQGCNHKCKGCHNPCTWSFKKNEILTEDEVIEYIERHNFSKKVTLSGGDPLEQNILGLLKKLKQKEYNIWLYTGYEMKEIKEKYSEILEYTDVIVDGKFELENRDISLEYRGSSNQKINYMKK